jgi:hypothetical protein
VSDYNGFYASESQRPVTGENHLQKKASAHTPPAQAKPPLVPSLNHSLKDIEAQAIKHSGGE